MRRAVVCALAIGLALGALRVALGSWSLTGDGPSSAAATSVNAGSAPAVIMSGRTAQVSWSPATLVTGTAVTGYEITRYDSSGTTEQVIASGSCASIVPGTSCSETAVPPGTWRYSVTPAFNNWRGTESGTTVANVDYPALALAPATVTTPATLTGSITDFSDSETLRFRLDSPTGTVLTGTVDGNVTPAAVPAGGSASVSVQLPGGTSEGLHDIYAVATESGDNTSASVTVDNTAPAAPTMTSTPPAQSSSSSASFSFIHLEPLVTFECRLDGGSWLSCTSAKLYTGLSDGSHTFEVRARDSVGLLSPGEPYTWSIDTVAPSAAVSAPATGSTYSSASYTALCGTPATGDVCGTASDVGGGLANVKVSIRRPGGNFWDGSGFNSATEVLLNATGTSSWSYGFTAASFPLEGSYVVRAVPEDLAGNTGSATSTFTYDATGPSSVVTFPATGSRHNNNAFTAGCGTAAVGDFCGTAADGASGVSTVQVSIQQGSGNYYNGTGFSSASEVLLNATGTTSWSYNFAATSFPAEGAYTLRVRSTDAVGNTGSVSSSTFTIDRTAPSATDIQTQNKLLGVAGQAELGDTVTYTFSENMSPSSILSGWSGASTNMVVRITNGAGAANDTITVWNSAYTAQLPLGSVDLGRKDYVTATMTFGATGTASTMAMTGSTVTVTLGTPSAVAGVVAQNSSMVWTPSTTATDVAGNAMSATTRTETGAADPEF